MAGLLRSGARKRARRVARGCAGGAPAVSRAAMIAGPGPLHYLSELDRDWAKALSAATTWEALQNMVVAWKAWAPDALAVVETMNSETFKEFRAGLESERHKTFAGEPWARKYGALLIPARLMEITIRAEQFGVPFGTMAIRLAEVGGKP